MGKLDDILKRSKQYAQASANYFGVGRPGLGQFGSNFATGMNVARNANQSRLVRTSQGVAQGVGTALNTGLGIVNRAMNNPIVNKAVNYIPGNQVVKTGLNLLGNQKVTNLINNSRQFLDKNAPTTTAGKVGSFVGQNIPALLLPATKGVEATRIASPAMRLLANAGLRGAENAAFGLANKYGKNEFLIR
jgi:hypothetical protein